MNLSIKFRPYFWPTLFTIISLLILILIIIVSFYSYEKYKINKKKYISDRFNMTTIDYSESSKIKTLNELIEIINEKDPTYSLLSLYY